MRTQAEWDTLVYRSIVRARVQIANDIALGKVPGWVRDFTSLHDYVDANAYGGLTEEGWIEGEIGNMTDATVRAASRVQESLDRWLRAGRPGGLVTDPETALGFLHSLPEFERDPDGFHPAIALLGIVGIQTVALEKDYAMRPCFRAALHLANRLHGRTAVV